MSCTLFFSAIIILTAKAVMIAAIAPPPPFPPFIPSRFKPPPPHQKRALPPSSACTTISFTAESPSAKFFSLLIAYYDEIPIEKEIPTSQEISPSTIHIAP
ncbi:hypothetical protein CEUSTIGMA_g7443.t1, partial [Chlamydomonas eustigma]